ncbi:MAG: PorP/SprF family type IX secretion system membrane protein [Cyclobacteriaceae bacterium]|nr:PorP/SprF family type IX secretion system membrane protein [Cyclobacteriaceae bacterium]
MKKIYSTILLLLISFALQAQDIPLFSQKLTNSFIYNPAVAGHTLGSATYSYRQSYNGIANAPRNNFISVHTPVGNHKFGIGANFYQEEVNFLKNSYASAAFAYHIQFNRTSSLSMGVAGEYNFMRLSGRTNSDASDQDYIKLSNGELNDYDFSFGLLYQTRFFKAGLAANRLATGWIKEDNATILSNYYSGFAQGMIPMRGGEDMLEPYFAFRKFSETNDTYDLGLYYTYSNRLLAGGSYRSGGVAALTAGVYLTPKLLLGYSREMFVGEVRNQVGSTNEFTLRFDFNAFDYRNNFKADYLNSMAYRRKTLNSAKPGSSGSKGPAQLHKQQKKMAAYSPNKRYQNINKLSMTPGSQHYKLSAAKKKSYKKKKRK